MLRVSFVSVGNCTIFSPIADAISYGSYSSQPQGPPCEARVGSAVSHHSNYVRGSFAFARSREILRVLRPRFNRRGHLVHRYYPKSLMLTLLLLMV